MFKDRIGTNFPFFYGGDRVLHMSHFLNHNFHQVLWTPLEIWLEDHPLVHWFLLHPLLMLSLMLIGLILLAGLMSAIAQLTQNLWLRLLQLPVQLVQSIGWAIATGLRQLFRRFFHRSSLEVLDESAISDHATNVDSALTRHKTVVISHNELQPLLERLEWVRQEESQLIEQIKALMDERSP